MTIFKPELKEQLREELTKTVSAALRDNLTKAMRSAMQDALDDVVHNQVFEALDKMLDNFLDDEQMDCWLSFDDGGPHVLLGIGPGDCAAYFTPELPREFADDFDNFNIQNNIERDNIGKQIECISNFISVLQKQLIKLELTTANYDKKWSVQQ